MPIEIRELIIRAFVEPSSTGNFGSNENKIQVPDTDITDTLQDLLKLLNTKNER